MSNSDFVKYYKLVLGKASKHAINLINSKPDNEYQTQALARSLRVFYSFYVGILVGKNKLTSNISKNIDKKLDNVNSIINDSTLAHGCKDIMMRVSGATAESYEKELDMYQKDTKNDCKQCYKDIKSLKPLNKF